MKLCSPTTFVLIIIYVQGSLQSTDDGIPPVLTVNIPDVELDEKENARTKLGGGPVVTCVDAGDGDPARAYIASILPTSGCGLGCLQLEPCSGTENFCLWYLASQDALSYSGGTVYTLTIGCTDDVEGITTADMTVTIVSNSPPTFIPDSPPYASTNTHGQKTSHESRTLLYKVETNDADDDPVYYTMSTSPITDLLEIEYTTGQIKAAHDLRMLCEPKVVASVRAKDPYSSLQGPFTVDIDIDNYNTRPYVTNLDTTVTIDENEKVDKRVLEFDVVDTKLNDLTYYQRSTTSAGMDVYAMRAPSLRTLVELDYEREDTRSVKLYFDISDGYCKSETYSLTVNVNDVPEEPAYSHTYMLIMTDEGQINEPNNVFVLDDDLNEVHTHAEESGTHDFFDVDPTTGNIVGTVALVSGRQYKDFTVRMRATDKDGLTSRRYEAKVRVFDINDQRPYFTNSNDPHRVSAHECLPPGSVLGRMKGDDDDSEYNLNNWFYFGGGGAIFTIAANGWIVLQQQCTDGQTYTGTATITDMGIKPGPLTGDPRDVQVICGPCPAGGATTTAAAPVTTVDPNSTTDAAAAQSGSGSGGGSSPDALLSWLVPALIGGLAWLALTLYFCYRFFRHCKNPCAGCCQPKPKPITVTPEPPSETPPKSRRLPPPPPPKTPSPPPLAPPPVTPPDPYLFGFWKETYTDQDQNKVAAKAAKPKPIEHMPLGEGNALPPEHLRLGPRGADVSLPSFLPGKSPADGRLSTARASDVTPVIPGATPEAQKKKQCTIL